MPCQSNDVFDESETVVLSQINDKMLSTYRFERAGCIRRFQKEFANFDHELTRDFCRRFPLVQKPDQCFENPPVLYLVTQGLLLGGRMLTL